VSEWLDVMLQEIARKQREATEAEEEQRRREDKGESQSEREPDHSK